MGLAVHVEDFELIQIGDAVVYTKRENGRTVLVVEAPASVEVKREKFMDSTVIEPIKAKQETIKSLRKSGGGKCPA